MQPIAAIPPAVISPLVQSNQEQTAERANQAALRASQADLAVQVARQTATAAPGASVNVQERLTLGPDGQLVVGSATVTITQEPAATSGNVGGAVRAEGIQDQINISAQAQEQVGLNAKEQAVVRELAARDAEVRVHEGLHFRTASGLGRAPNFETVQGPDGKFYAVGGSVEVSSTRGADPEQAAREAQTLGLAATAPGDASAPDLAAARSFAQNTAQNTGQNTDISGPNPAEDEPTGIAQNVQDTQGEQENRGENVDLFA